MEQDIKTASIEREREREREREEEIKAVVTLKTIMN